MTEKKKAPAATTPPATRPIVPRGTSRLPNGSVTRLKAWPKPVAPKG